jgi:hypothetical protein
MIARRILSLCLVILVSCSSLPTHPDAVLKKYISIYRVVSRKGRESYSATAFPVGDQRTLWTARHFIDNMPGRVDQIEVYDAFGRRIEESGKFQLTYLGNSKVVPIQLFGDIPGVPTDFLKEPDRRLTDVAVLRFDRDLPGPPLTMATKKPKPGDFVIGAGYSWAVQNNEKTDLQLLFSRGAILSSREMFQGVKEEAVLEGLEIFDQLYTSQSLFYNSCLGGAGMSGGPIFNQMGEVVGLYQSSTETMKDPRLAKAIIALDTVSWIPRLLREVRSAPINSEPHHLKK